MVTGTDVVGLTCVDFRINLLGDLVENILGDLVEIFTDVVVVVINFS